MYRLVFVVLVIVLAITVVATVGMGIDFNGEKARNATLQAQAQAQVETARAQAAHEATLQAQAYYAYLASVVAMVLGPKPETDGFHLDIGVPVFIVGGVVVIAIIACVMLMRWSKRQMEDA